MKDFIGFLELGIIEGYIATLIPQIMSFFVSVLLAFLLWVIGKRVIKFILKTMNKGFERHNVDTGVRQFLSSLCKYAMYAILVFLMLTLFGLTASSVVAVVGSAGLTLGLALQGSLSNFAGGVLILLLKPFEVGDYIIESAFGNEGTVKEISTFYTTIVTVDNRTVIVPNGKLSDNVIVNVSRQDYRRIDLNIGISYDADIKKAKEVLQSVVGKEARISTAHPVDIFVSDLADSCVSMGCRVWVQKDDYWNCRWDLLENIKYAYDEAGIEIPYNKLDVNIIQ